MSAAGGAWARWAVIGAMAVAAGAAGALTAAPARAADETPAERLHEAAVTAHRAGRLQQAIELWRDALRLEPNWKYAYNLANTLYETEQGSDAWDALARSEALRPPDKYAGQVLELKSKVRALLYKDHAWLALEVHPAGAGVKRNGQPWSPPYETWVTEEESTIEVAADGYVTRTEQVKHPIGHRTEVHVALEQKGVEAPRLGTLRVGGTPVGATVIVGGTARGTLPLGPIDLPSGITDVRVTMPGYADGLYDASIEPGREATVDAALKKLVPKVEANGLATPGWIAIAGGVVLAAFGTGFYFWADATRDDIANLQSSPPEEMLRGGYLGYSHRYDQLKSSFDTRLTASQVLLGVGGAAIATGVVLVLLDRSPSEGEGTVEVVPVSGGGMLVGGARF